MTFQNHIAVLKYKFQKFQIHPDDAFRAGLRKLGQKKKVRKFFPTKKKKKHEWRKSPIPYFIVIYTSVFVTQFFFFWSMQYLDMKNERFLFFTNAYEINIFNL